MAGPNKTQKKYIKFIAIAMVFLVAGVIFAPLIQDAWSNLTGQAATATPNKSSLTVYSWTDGEDVSNFMPVKVYKPDDSKVEGPDDWEKLYEGITYWDEEYSGDAEDFDEDISGWSHILFDFDSGDDTVFMRNQVIMTVTGNTNFIQYGYHLSSDINFNVFDVTTMGAITASGHQSDGNYTLEFQFPTYTTSNLHYGSNWEISSDDYDDMTTEEKEDLWNENLWRCQAPQYLLGEDSDNDYTETWERITNTYGFKFTFNDTINATDGSVTQVNFTLSDDSEYDFTKVVSGEYIYLLGEDIVDCEFNSAELDFELEYAANITLSNVHSARFDVFNEEDSATVDSTYSSIGA